MTTPRSETDVLAGMPETSEADERRQSYRAIFALLHKHDTDISLMQTHAHAVTQQVSELTASMHLLRREIPNLMAAGLMQAVSDPELWHAAGKAMHANARSAAGGWLFGGMKAAAMRVLWIAIAAFALYSVGGPTAVMAWFKAQHP